MIRSLFTSCTRFLTFLSKTFNVTYKEISVIINIYIQGGIMMLSGVMPAAVLGYYVADHGSLTRLTILAFLLLYAAMYVMLYVLLLRRYRLPMSKAFDLCVNDMDRMAGNLNMSYQGVNLFVFVFSWLLLLVFNIAITGAIYYFS